MSRVRIGQRSLAFIARLSQAGNTRRRWSRRLLTLGLLAFVFSMVGWVLTAGRHGEMDREPLQVFYRTILVFTGDDGGPQNAILILDIGRLLGIVAASAGLLLTGLSVATRGVHRWIAQRAEGHAVVVADPGHVGRIVADLTRSDPAVAFVGVMSALTGADDGWAEVEVPGQTQVIWTSTMWSSVGWLHAANVPDASHVVLAGGDEAVRFEMAGDVLSMDTPPRLTIEAPNQVTAVRWTIALARAHPRARVDVRAPASAPIGRWMARNINSQSSKGHPPTSTHEVSTRARRQAVPVPSVAAGGSVYIIESPFDLDGRAWAQQIDQASMRLPNSKRVPRREIPPDTSDREIARVLDELEPATRLIIRCSADGLAVRIASIASRCHNIDSVLVASNSLRSLPLPNVTVMGATTLWAPSPRDLAARCVHQPGSGAAEEDDALWMAVSEADAERLRQEVALSLKLLVDLGMSIEELAVDSDGDLEAECETSFRGAEEDALRDRGCGLDPSEIGSLRTALLAAGIVVTGSCRTGN